MKQLNGSFGKWEILKKMRFLYKLSFFVTNKINLVDFKPKNEKFPL